MGVSRIELVLRQRLVAQSELDRHIVKPAGREAAIEMPQSRNDHSDDRDLDVGAGLIEDEEVEALSLGKAHASGHLLARVEMAELRIGAQPGRRMADWRQEGMVPQVQRRGAVKARFLPAPASQQTDGQKLIQLGQRAQQRY